MDSELLQNIFEKLFKSDLLDDPFTISWHSGEPLTLGLPFYEYSFELIDRLNVNNIKINHNFQTNATLINRDWVNLFRKHKVSVGISLDGPKDLHDKNRKNWAGQGTYEAVMRGVRLMKESGISLSALCVVTADSMLRGAELFQFFVEEGFTWLGLNIETPSGSHTSTTFTQHHFENSEADYEERIKCFWSDLYDAWFPHRHNITVREITSMLGFFKKLQSDVDFFPDVHYNQSFRILSFGKYGDITTFSPELLSGIPDSPQHFAIANILDLDDIAHAKNSLTHRKLADEISRGISKCKVECTYFSVCGGGSPYSKYSENGSFDCTQTLDCRYGTQLLADTLLYKLKPSVVASNANILKN